MCGPLPNTCGPLPNNAAHYLTHVAHYLTHAAHYLDQQIFIVIWIFADFLPVVSLKKMFIKNAA